MPDEKKIEIWDCQEWVRTAPLKTAANFVWWAQGVIDMREADEANKTKRKQRSDAGKKRDDAQQPIDLREITK